MRAEAQTLRATWILRHQHAIISKGEAVSSTLSVSVASSDTGESMD